MASSQYMIRASVSSAVMEAVVLAKGRVTAAAIATN